MSKVWKHVILILRSTKSFFIYILNCFGLNYSVCIPRLKINYTLIIYWYFIANLGWHLVKYFLLFIPVISYLFVNTENNSILEQKKIRNLNMKQNNDIAIVLLYIYFLIWFSFNLYMTTYYKTHRNIKNLPRIKMKFFSFLII